MRLHGVARSTANRVMLIDKDYTRALVGSSSADYLWILSRTSGLSETAKSELLYEARRRGYDTDKLIWVRQEMYESDVVDEVLAAQFPFKISILRLTMSRRFGIIESF